VQEATPITCTLSQAERAARGPEWRDALRNARAQITDAEGGVSITFTATGDELAEIHDLVRAESACCAWMQFEMASAAAGSTLLITSESDEGADLIREMLRGDG